MTNVKFCPPIHTTKMYSIIVYYSIIIINYIMYNKGKFPPPKIESNRDNISDTPIDTNSLC